MRKPRSLQDDDAEETSLRPPLRRDVGAPVPRNEEMPSDDKTAAAKDTRMASSETTPKTGKLSTASFYPSSLQKQAMRQFEANDDMARSLRPPLRKLLVEIDDDTFPVATGDAERDTKIKATTNPQQVWWIDANEGSQEGTNLGVNSDVDKTLQFTTEDVRNSVGSMEATKQCAQAQASVGDPSDYSAASSEASNQYEKTAAAVSHVSGNPATNNAVSRGRILLPQTMPGAVRVPGIYSVSGSDQHSALSVTESAQLMDNEVHASNISETGVMVTAYAVDDQVHEASLVNTKKKRLRRCLWTTVIVAVVVVVVAVVVPTARKETGDNGEMKFSSFITGLCSPRHMKVHNGQLFVAEAGVGPEDPNAPILCVPGILRLFRRQSLFRQDGSGKSVSSRWIQLSRTESAHWVDEWSSSSRKVGQPGVRASAVDFDANGTMFTIVGLGFANTSDLEGTGLDFASVFRGDQAVASPWVPLHENNYAGVDIIETNPFHILIHNGITYVVDAGADLLYTYLNVTTAGNATPDSVIVLPRIDDIPAVEPDRGGGACSDVEPPYGPPYCGQNKTSEGDWVYSTGAVPTAVRVNPTEPNRIYVSYLGGAMWNEKVSRIVYMDLVDGIPKKDTLKEIKGHFHAIIDFGFYKNYLFVLETKPGGFTPFNGRLSKVAWDSNEMMRNMTPEIITDDLSNRWDC